MPDAPQPQRRHSLPLAVASCGLSLLALWAWRQTRDRQKQRQAKYPPETAALESELLLRMRQAQARFLGTISHEIRTPLAGVLGFADQLLLDCPQQGPHFDNLRSLRRCAKHLTHILDDLLVLSQLELDPAPVSCRTFSLLDLLHDLSSIFELQRGDKKVDLRIGFNSPLPEFLTTDPQRLRQILLQLLGNTLKLTPDGTLNLDLALQQSLTPDRAVLEFHISASGTALSPHRGGDWLSSMQAEDCFEAAFSQMTSGWPGLCLAKRIAQQLGGDLTLVERKAQDSYFLKGHVPTNVPQHNRLMGQYVPPPSLRDSATDIRSFEGKLKDIRVLLVEDGLDNQRIFSYFLRLAGAQVEIEVDGFRALERLDRERDFDIVLMDIQLPVMDGIAVTKKLRGGGFDRPIIAVSAHALHDENMRLETLEQGFSDYLTKPVEIERLIRLLMFHTGRLESQQGYHASQPMQEQSLAAEVFILSKYHHQAVYRQMIIEFAEGLEQRWQLCEHLLEEQRWVELGRVMHQLRGAAATYGYPSLSERAGEIEKDVLEEGGPARESIVGHMRILKSLCDRIKAGINRI